MITTEIEFDSEVWSTEAQLTISRVSAGLESCQAPMIGQILRIIKDISGRADSMSVNDLVEFISSEPTTMGKVVSIAGSVGYNSGGVEISSIHHAVSFIGFDRVRTLAISILLLEGAQSEFTAEANRELAGQALISGLVAAEMCRRNPQGETELAFLCGALRGYGRMLAATFMPAEYSAAMTFSAQQGYERAFESVFGLTPLELGRELLANLQLPKTILNTFVALSPLTRKGGASKAVPGIVLVSDFGLRVAELLQAADLTSGNFEFRMESLSAEYESAFHLTRTATRELLHHLVSMLECFRFRAGSYVGSVAMFRRLECLASERPLPAAFGGVFKTVPDGSRPAAMETDSATYEI